MPQPWFARNLDRWLSAQRYERGYWEGLARKIADGAVSQLDWYRWRADQLISWLRELGLEGLTRGSARVLEVGSGPIGVVSCLPGTERWAVDPLAMYYALHPTLAALRDSDVRYLQAVGEELPFPSCRFDLVIIENCIDHVREVDAVMREIIRVLRPGGVLYLTVNCRSQWGYVVHRVLSRLRIDAGHPHTFTRRRLHNTLRARGFRILGVEAGSFWRAFREDLASPKLRARLKAGLGVSEFLVSVIAGRSGGAG